MARPRIAVIGAGLAGLAAAYDLAGSGHEVVVLEAATRAGGLAAGFRRAGWDWELEQYYHHWFASDTSVLRLLEELGLRDQAFFPRPTTVIYDGGAFHPFDSPARILSFLARRFSLADAIRFGLVGLYLRLTPFWRHLERSTADAWMRRACGARVHEAIWRPLLVSKFGEENLDTVNMAWLWARLKVRTPRLGTFRGGFQRFIDTLAERAAARGAAIRFESPVTAIAAGGPRRLLVTTGATGAPEPFDAVLATTSPALLARIAPGLPSTYASALRDLRSLGALVVVLALDRPLGSAYWYNLAKSAGFPFLALVEHTNFVDPVHYGGDHLVYLGDYLDPSHPTFRLTKEDLLEQYLPALTRFNPAFERSWIRESWLFHTPYAQPIPGLEHSRHVPSVRTPLAGLYAASMSQVYPWDRGTNFALALGRDAARLIARDLAGG